MFHQAALVLACFASCHGLRTPSLGSLRKRELLAPEVDVSPHYPTAALASLLFSSTTLPHRHQHAAARRYASRFRPRGSPSPVLIAPNRRGIRFSKPPTPRNSAVLSTIEKKRSMPWEEWKILLTLAAPDWKRMTIAIGALFIAALCESFMPALEGAALNAAIGIGSLSELKGTLIKLCLVGLSATSFAALRGWMFTICAARLVARLRSSVFSALVAQPQAFHDEQGPGVLSSRLASDCIKLGDVLSVNLSIFLRNLVLGLSSLNIVMRMNARLSIMILLFTVFRSISTYFFSGVYRRLSGLEQSEMAKASGVTEQCFSLMRLVRAYDSAADERRRYDQQLEHVIALKKSQGKYYAGAIVCGSSLDRAMIASVIFFGSCLVAGGSLPRNQLAAFLLYTNVISNSLRSCAHQWGTTQVAFGAAAKVFDYLRVRDINGTVSTKSLAYSSSLLRESSPGYSRFTARDDGAKSGALTFSSVSFAYPYRDDSVLKNVSFSIRSGERVAILGQSGSGKSTIFALALRLYSPSAGKITLDGIPVDQLDEPTLRSKVAWVQQEPPLFPNLTIHENIAYGLRNASRESVEAAARDAFAYDFIDQLPDAFDTRIGASGASLSGGQKQRIALARALIRNSALLLLDEPTSALDPESEAGVTAALFRKDVKGRRTMIFTTHKLAQAQYADRIIVMSNGKIVEQGSHDELLKNRGKYAKYFSDRGLV